MFNLLKITGSLLSVIYIYSGLAQPAATQAEPYIRVAILEGVVALEIAGEQMTVESSRGRKEIGSRANIEITGAALKVNGKRYAPPIRIRAARGMLYVNSKQYRGEIILHRKQNGIMAVNRLPLETYLVGLINAEVNSSWPMEALKAQAVVARTFAMKKRHERRSKLFDVRSDVSDQVYHGSALEDAPSFAAVNDTKSEVLMFSGELITAYYHSTCGGRTASSMEVWGEKLDYLPGVKCDWCVDSPRYFWKYVSSGKDLGQALLKKNIKVGNVKKIRTINKTPSGRNYRLEIVGSMGRSAIDAADLRAAVGYTKIFSTNFELFEPEPGQFVFLGKGSGHGVGMCQWGAYGLAGTGKSYLDILAHYYPGSRLRKKKYP